MISKIHGDDESESAPTVTRRQSLGGLGLTHKFIMAMTFTAVLLITVFGWITFDLTKKRFTQEIDNSGAHLVKTISMLGYEYFLLSDEIDEDDNPVPANMRDFDRSQEIQRLVSRLNVRMEESLLRGNTKSSDIIAAYVTDYTGKQFVLGSEKSVDIKQGVQRNYTGDVRIEISNARFNNIPVRKFRMPITAKTDETLGYAEVVISAEKLLDVERDLKRLTAVAACGATAFAIIIGIILSSIVTRPVRALVQDMNVVSAGDLNHRTISRSNDEIGLLARTFNEMTKNLRIAQQAELSNHMMEHELNIASEIQARLLPKKIPRIQGFDIYAYYRSAKHVGGDYYDYLPIDKEHLGFIVADVSGKGIAGALVMAQTRSIMRLEAGTTHSPAEALKKTNAILAREIRRGMFVTVMYAILNVRTHTLVVSSAGHNSMVIYRAKNGAYELVNPNGIALGFDQGPVFEKTIKEETVQLNKGDRVILYTDGVVEAMNSKKQEFGEDRFYKIFQKEARRSSKELVNILINVLDQHQGAAEQHDDITISTLMVV